jgi:hypothetical protein
VVAEIEAPIDPDAVVGDVDILLRINRPKPL